MNAQEPLVTGAPLTAALEGYRWLTMYVRALLMAVMLISGEKCHGSAQRDLAIGRLTFDGLERLQKVVRVVAGPRF